ncbi:MAG TPA: DnaB-like helicase N-terminal domain-containing protein, partial [Blastocatellia bacterium]|nr:DnaB-like helicase N-terminal domain-containing protein [Blastocatellia bacterium]
MSAAQNRYGPMTGPQYTNITMETLSQITDARQQASRNEDGGPPIERLPAEPDIERALLGAILMDGRLIEQARSLIRPTHLHLHRHRALYGLMLTMWER